MRLSKSMALMLLVAHHHEHDHEHEQTAETLLLGRSWESQCLSVASQTQLNQHCTTQTRHQDMLSGSVVADVANWTSIAQL